MGTINITGTGGIIEGNLGAANVNVNLEPAPRFDETASATTNSYITGADINDMEVATYSIMCWFKPIPSNGTQQDNANGALIIKDNTVLMSFHNSTGTVRCYSRPDGSWSSVTTSTTDCRNSWHHACFTWDGSNNRLYIDGNLEATVAASGAAAAGNSNKFIFGAKGQDDDQYEGYIKDVKLYSAVLDATAIGIAAQKINTDLELIGNVSDCEAWYKFDDSTDSTPEDSTTNNNDCTGTGADVTWVHDAFSVDVYDGLASAGGTTTNGTFTVTQGKVEGKALTAAHFTGATNVYVGSTLTSNQRSTREQTFSCWFNADDVTGRGIAGRWTGSSQGAETSLHLDTSSNLVMRMNSTDADGSGSHSNQTVTGSTTIAADKWYHVVCVASSVGDDNFLKIYVNGVLDGTNASYGKYIQSAADQFRWGWGYGSTDEEFDGHIRDVRIYAGRALTADQVSSLYSNTLPITPDFWMKADAGSGTDAAAFGQSGLYTATSVSPNNIDSTWLNGTLDLDSTLTIQANGTLSAPRGSLDLHSHFTIAADTSTFTHNNGTVTLTSNVELFPADFDSSENARHIFYDIAHTTGTFYMERAVEIHGTYTKTGGELRHYAKCTFGTATTSGNMVINHTTWNMYGYYGNPMLYAANELFPVNIGGSVSDPINWDVIDQRASGGQNTVTHIKGIDFGNTAGTPATKNTTTGGGGARIQLDGDCEFDAFTVSSGDTLDLNGQRMKCDDLVVGGTADFGSNSLLVCTNLNPNGTVNNEEGASIIIRGDGAGDDVNLNDYYFVGDATTNVMIDNGSISTDWAGSYRYAGNLIIGSGTFRSQNSDQNNCNNLTVATGATLDADNDTITVAGDFTTSGGLIGKSGLLFDGTDDYMRAGTYGVANNFTGWSNNNITVEVWAKSSDSSQAGIMTSRWGASGSRQFILYQEANGSVRAAINSDGGSTYVSTNGAEAGVSNSWTSGRDGKWHHYALTYDGANLKLYIDGQLYANRATAVTLVNGVNSIFGIGAYNVNSSNTFSGNGGFIGDIHRCSVWNHTLTQSEIRGMMFYDYATMDADSDFNTPQGDLKGWYQFDEGTGTLIDNLTGVTNVDGLLVNSAWAGVGTFTRGTSTLKMTGTNKNITYSGDLSVNNVTIATGGDSNTINLNDIVGNNSGIVVFGTLEQESGKLASTSNEYIQIGKTFGDVKVAAGKGAIAFADVAKWFVFQNGQSGTKNFPSPTSDDKNLTIQTMFINSSSTIQVAARGNLTFTATLFVDGGNTFNANGNTIAAKVVDINNGILDLRNSNLEFSVTGSGDSCDLGGQYGGTLLTGNTTITGHSSANKTGVYARAVGNFEVVGDIKFLNIQADGDGDLTVIGSVIDCTAAAGAGLRQWHHTLDTQQLLDADEAGDDDLRLTKPALDNALELMTK